MRATPELRAIRVQRVTLGIPATPASLVTRVRAAPRDLAAIPAIPGTVVAQAIRGQAETQALEDRGAQVGQGPPAVLMRMLVVTPDFQALLIPARQFKVSAITDRQVNPQAVPEGREALGLTLAPCFGPSTHPATLRLLTEALDFEVLQEQPADRGMRGTQVPLVIRARLVRPVTTAAGQTQATQETLETRGEQARRVQQATPEWREVRAQPVQQVMQPHSWRLTSQAGPVAMPVQAEPQAMQVQQVQQARQETPVTLVMQATRATMVRVARAEPVVLVGPQAILATPEMPEVVVAAAVDRAARQAPQLEPQPQDLTGLVIPMQQPLDRGVVLATTLAQARAVVEACFTRPPQAPATQAVPETQEAQEIPAMQVTPEAPVIRAAVGQMAMTALPVLPVAERATAAQVEQAEQAGRAMLVTRALLRSRVTTLPTCCLAAPTPSQLDRAHRTVRL